MKKIIAVILALASMLVLFSCNQNTVPEEDTRTDLQKVTDYYAASCPTKCEVNYTYDLSGKTATGKSTLVTGKIAGKIATVYTYEFEKMASISDDATSAVTKETGSKEYLEDKGVRTNASGKWAKDGTNFAPTLGSIAINLDAAIIKEYTYKNNTLTFVVAADDTATILGEENAVNADVTVTIVDDGAVVTGITLDYTLPKTSRVDKTHVTYVTVYSYDLQTVELLK